LPGGRTVYDNLNKSLFEAVPLFVDSFGNFVLLNWESFTKAASETFILLWILSGIRAFVQVYAESLEGESRVKSQESRNENQEFEDSLMQKIGRS